MSNLFLRVVKLIFFLVVSDLNYSQKIQQYKYILNIQTKYKCLKLLALLGLYSCLLFS